MTVNSRPPPATNASGKRANAHRLVPLYQGSRQSSAEQGYPLSHAPLGAHPQAAPRSLNPLA